ncbi:adenylate/guanylate cyclase domain-containing protein [Methylocystis sp. IM3]|uniref:adenylate/guanylate cyclase domain-containing protein n=1 Tax=unclassified Methylocystis TaxID=2625913 RepID=UPI003119C9E1
MSDDETQAGWAKDHPGLIFECGRDADGAVRFFDVTGGLREAMGVAARAGRDWLEGEDADAFARALENSARDGAPFIIDLRVDAADGRRLCLETHVAPRVGGDGAPRWAAVGVDVTERRRAERSLSLLHKVGVAISEAPDYETAITETLRYACRVLNADYGEAWTPDHTDSKLALCSVVDDGHPGWTPFAAAQRETSHEMDRSPIGLSWRTRRALWADDVETLIDAAQRCAAPPAHARRLSVYVQPIAANDGVIALFVFYLDRRAVSGLIENFKTAADQLATVLQRRRIEQELEYANIIVEQSPTVIYRALAIEGAPRVYTSRNVTRFGYSVEDCKMGRFNFPDFVHADDRPRVLQEVLRMIEGDEDVFEQDYRLIAADGAVHHIHDRTVAIRDANGTITHWQGALTDITERWLAQHRLSEANAKLEDLSVKLSKYVSPQIYRSIFSGEQSGEICARRKKLTIFFSDIADFTRTTDALESEELTGFLNHYLTEMSKIALSYGATIDKYIGDAILAFFGDPETRGVREDALACVRMAMAMQSRMRALQREWRGLGAENPFQLRIGVNTGFCTVGNFGSEDRMDYTVIGGEVNLAARLQSHSELGGVLIGHETYSLVKDEIPSEELEPITVKGFAKPVRVYRVLAVGADAAAGADVLHYQRPGALINVDFDRLAEDDLATLRKIADMLNSRLSPAEGK